MIGQKIVAQFSEGPVFEQQRPRQLTEVLFETLGELDHHDRVDPVLLQRHRDLDARLREADLRRKLLLQIRQQPVAISEGRTARLGRFGADCGRWIVHGIESDAVGIAKQGEHLVLTGLQGGLEHPESALGVDRGQSRAGQGFLDRGGRLHAACHPGGPVDRQRRPGPLTTPSLKLAPLGEFVEKGVRIGVVGLSEVAEDAGDRREEDEDIERFIPRRLVEEVTAPNLGREHRPEILAGLLEQQTVTQDPSRLDDAVQGAETAFDRLDRRDDLGAIRDVGTQMDDLGALGFQFGDHRPPVGRQCRTSHQGQPGPEVPGEIAREEQAETAQSAHDQIDPLFTQRQRGDGFGREDLEAPDLASSVTPTDPMIARTVP